MSERERLLTLRKLFPSRPVLEDMAGRPKRQYRRKGGRRGSRIVRIPFRANVALGTLGSGTVLTAGILTFGEDFYCTSIVATWTNKNHKDENPIHCVLAHGDLTDVEIGEAWDASPSDPDDLIAIERSRRKVRKVGQIVPGPGVDGYVGADGEKIYTKMGMSIGDGHTLDFGVINNTGAALTTGMDILIDGVAYGRWQR